MAKRRTKRPKIPTLAELPPAPPLPAPPDPTKPGRRFITRDQKARRWLTIQAMVTQGRPDREIYQITRQEFHIGEVATRKIIVEVIEDWMRKSAQCDLRVERERHKRRIELRLQQATSATRRNPNTNELEPDYDKWRWGVVTQLEQLYSRVAGTAQPVEVNHSGQVGVALAGVVANLTEAEADAIVAEELELERKAQERDQLIVDAVPALPPKKVSGSAA